jgi:hypothetical protein
MGNVLKGIGSGLAGLVGFGQMYNPVADAQGKVQAATQHLNNIAAQDAFLGLKALQGEVGGLSQAVSANINQMRKVIQKNQTIAFQKLAEENYFLIILFIFIFIIFIYLLLQP